MSNSVEYFHDDFFAVKARQPLAHDCLPEGTIKYDRTILIDTLPPEAVITVDFLTGQASVITLLGGRLLEEFGKSVSGAGINNGVPLFQDHSLLTIYYPELVSLLGENMPIYECVIKAPYFQTSPFRETNPGVLTVGDAQHYIIERFIDWGKNLRVEVIPLSV